jgi:hypothetical protein
MNRVKFCLMLIGIGMFYLVVTLIALGIGLIGEALAVAPSRPRERIIPARWLRRPQVELVGKLR